MRAIRFHVDSFGSAQEVLASALLNDIACLIPDVYLPGMSQRALNNGTIDLPGKPVRREILFKALHSAVG